MTTLRIALLAALAAAGCKQSVDLGGEYKTVLDLEPEPITALDLLFVIDNSGSMIEEQTALVEAAGAHMFGVLEGELGELPDMHIGFVSTDVGAGPYNISGCLGEGDDGLLQDAPRINGCTPPADVYLTDAPNGAGGRVRNYEGTLQDAFACIGKLGIDGCGFEQPLESARRALDGRHPENDGFLRDDALLMIVIITDEDDCSAFDVDMFDTSQNSVDDPLGPLSSFRCFEFGVVCDGDEPRSPGEKTGCRAREDSPYITSLSDLTAALRDVKPDPSRVAVALISGGAEVVDVGTDDHGNPWLAPLCEAGAPPPECDGVVWDPDAGPGESVADAGGLTPADCDSQGEPYASVRLNAFLEAFPGRSHFTPMCELGIAAHLEASARLASDVMSRNPCLRGRLVDFDTERSGVQARCRAYDVAMEGGREAERTPVKPCAETGGETPCFTMVEDTDCAHVDTKLAVDVQRGEQAPARPAHLVVECVTPLDLAP